MLNNFMEKLPVIMKDKEPDLKALLGADLKEMGVELLNPVVVKNVSVSFNSSFAAGVGLSTLQGNVVINFKDKFSLKIKDPNTGSENKLKVANVVNLTVSKEGFTKIVGIDADIPGPFSPSVKSALIVGNNIEIKVGPVTVKVLLPEGFKDLL